MLVLLAGGYPDQVAACFFNFRGKEKRTEGERPGSCTQARAAVFRRERMPASIDRNFMNCEEYEMKQKVNVRKMVLCAIFASLAFVLNTFVYFPAMAPFQHFVDVVAAVFLGPWWA